MAFVRTTKPTRKVNASLDEIKTLVDEIADAEDELRIQKEGLGIKEKRDRLKAIMRSAIPLDENKEHYVLVNSVTAARVYFRTGRINVDVDLLRQIVPADVFEKVTKQSPTQVVLEVASPSTLEKRRQTFKREV